MEKLELTTIFYDLINQLKIDFINIKKDNGNRKLIVNFERRKYLLLAKLRINTLKV
jgi:hypothetical protein